MTQIEKHRGTFQPIKTNDVNAFFLQKSYSQRNFENNIKKSPYAASPRPRIQVKHHFSQSIKAQKPIEQTDNEDPTKPASANLEESNRIEP
jgi:hypothetical protein